MNGTVGRRTLPIRKLLVLSLALLIILPVFVTGAVAFHIVGIGTTGRDNAIAEIRDNPDRWTDPQWQEATRRRFEDQGIDFTLIQDGQAIYRTREDPILGRSSRLVDEFVVTEANPRRVFYIYSNQYGGGRANFWILPITGLTTLLLTLTALAWFIGRTVLRPLAATSDAARSIAEGNLEFEIPSSRVREVAEVNDAFSAMSDALRESLSEQAEVEQERRIFISAIVHDLRTPIFALRGYLEGLQQGVADTPEKRQRYVEIAQDKAAALERLITDLFEFTRLEYLEQAPNREAVDFGELVNRLVDSMRPQAEAKNVQLSVAPQTEPSTVIGDAHLLSRVVENLLVNSIRHTPSGGHVWLEYRNEPLWVRFSVFDTGPGIPEADLPRIFNPLFRGEQSRSRRTGGVGLGLTIARRIMQAHDGDLTAANHSGGGAVFTGTLPRPKASPQFAVAQATHPTEH
ncbi:MAG TPA: HAMP domain-containing sensor histidine kinase [Nitrolancea sp.]|nr:HAMP domain-containing sensor histidine kinase [Nitrolancea sp.]